MSSYCAIIPCFNEEENVMSAFARIKTFMERFSNYEIIFIDDGSTDRTLEIIKAISLREPRVRYLSFSRNFGLEAAFSAGFLYSRSDWTIQFDCDLQSPPEEAAKLVETAERGYDAVFGTRMDRQDPRFRRLGSRIQQLIATRLLGIELPIGGSVFRIVRTGVARRVLHMTQSSPYFLASLPKVTSAYTTVPTRHEQRQVGKSKWNIAKMLSHTMELYFGYSWRPLMCSGLLCFLGILAVLLTPYQAIAIASGLLAVVLTLPYVWQLSFRVRTGPMFLIRSSNMSLEPHHKLDCNASDDRRRRHHEQA